MGRTVVVAAGAELLAVACLIGLVGDGASDSAAAQVGARFAGGVRLVHTDPIGTDTWPPRPDAGHADFLQYGFELRRVPAFGRVPQLAAADRHGRSTAGRAAPTSQAHGAAHPYAPASVRQRRSPCATPGPHRAGARGSPLGSRRGPGCGELTQRRPAVAGTPEGVHEHDAVGIPGWQAGVLQLGGTEDAAVGGVLEEGGRGGRLPGRWRRARGRRRSGERRGRGPATGRRRQRRIRGVHIGHCARRRTRGNSVFTPLTRLVPAAHSYTTRAGARAGYLATGGSAATGQSWATSAAGLYAATGNGCSTCHTLG